MSQLELAEQLGIWQSKMSKIEAGLLEPSPSEVERLSQILDFPPPFFSWTDPVYGFATHEMFHRKRQRVTARKLSEIHAQLNLGRIRVSRLLQSAELDGDGFSRVDPDQFDGDPAEVARAVRAAWHLPVGPVNNVTDVIETAGGIVIPHDFGSRQFDAVSQWVPKLPPILFVNTNFPSDRMRFTLCHEIGHLILHRVVGPNAEEEADRFAAEFLMPARDIQHQLYDLTLPKLVALKQYWKTSMAALLKRATDLGTVTPRTARNLWMKMGKLGYRTKEPVDVPAEEPKLLRELVEFHTEELKYSLADLKEFLAANHIQSLLDGKPRHLTVVA